MSKMKIKEDLLKMLRDEMMEDHEDREYAKPESKMKATIMADSKEGLIEGAKKIPDALEKAEEYRQMRMSMSSKDKKKEDK
jgi:hypothetical protein|tara:strand:+ start:1376 stop:1618 length:243 start_codon:yes stop_codon:yes gene_type:complete